MIFKRLKKHILWGLKCTYPTPCSLACLARMDICILNGLGQLTRVDAHTNRLSKSRSRLYQSGCPVHRVLPWRSKVHSFQSILHQMLLLSMCHFGVPPSGNRMIYLQYIPTVPEHSMEGELGHNYNPTSRVKLRIEI